MTAESKRAAIAAGRRVVLAGLILLLAWLGLLGLRGTISPETINLLNAEIRMESRLPDAAPRAELSLNPWSWDWSKSLWTGRSVADTVGERLGVSLRLLFLAGVTSLVLAAILLLAGMVITRITERPAWLAKTRTILRLVLVSSGASVPIYVISVFLLVYAMTWFGWFRAGPSGEFRPEQVYWWAVIWLSILPAWLLVQAGHGELSNWSAQRRILDGTLWRHLAVKLVIRLLGLVGAFIAISIFMEQVAAQAGLGRQIIDAVNRRDFPVLFGVAWTFVVIVVLVKLAADLIEVAYKRYARVPLPTAASSDAVAKRSSIPKGWLVFCFALVGMFLLIAAAAPLLAPFGYNEMVLDARMQPPSTQYLLGTDNLGRDILSRVIFGIRTDITFSVIAVGVMFVIAAGWSLLAACVRRTNDWRGDTLEDVVMLPRDLLCAFPWLVTFLLLTVTIGMPTSGALSVLFPIPLVIGLVLLPRAVGMMQEAYRSPPQGKGWLHSTLTAVPVMLLFAIAGGVLYLATASFLGFGVPPPAPELGGMLSGPARRYMLQAPWMALWPPFILISILTAWVMAGEALLERFGFRSKAIWSKVWE